MQIRGLHKSKHFFFYGITYLVPALAIGSIYLQIQQFHLTNVHALESFLSSSSFVIIKICLTLLVLTTINWMLEAYKWQLAVRPVKRLSLIEAARQCLVGATSSILTPAKLGDYASKPAFYAAHQRPTIVLLNGLSHFFQMLTTGIFGTVSLVILAKHQPRILHLIDSQTGLVVIISLLILFLVIVPFMKLKMKKTYLKLLELLSVTNRQLCVSLMSLSITRYLIFSLQFILLLQLLGNPLDVYWTFIISSSIYIINSMLPTPAASDSIIKGSLGVFLFGLFGVNPWIVLIATLLMWLGNHVLPAVIGSIVMMHLKPGIKE